MSTTWVPASTFGSRLAEARRVARLSVEEAALACGLKHAAWSMWEREDSSPRNMAEVVEKIEAGLGVDRNYLMWGTLPDGPQRLSREHGAADQEAFSGSDMESFLDAVSAAQATPADVTAA